ncbi:MAG: ATP-dependent 6-phosphofructokinase [Methanoregula sp.]|uniref:6-phosphofructokinase n=1 Tax=Methanoregula sp. TaxID=2052170 RepID=UPI003C7567D1
MKITIGVLTGGGDCPGLNAAIRAVARAGTGRGVRVLGIRNGWQGLMENDTLPLFPDTVSGMIERGGTMLGTSRTDPVHPPDHLNKIRDTLEKNGMMGLVVIGGDGTLRAASELYNEGIPLTGIPKTIDNDVFGTEYAIGFDTAVSTVTEGIDRLRTTAESHHRIMVVEVMGRHTGWIAAFAGIAGGADEILIPEVPFTMDTVCRNLKNRYDAGKRFSIVVVAEGVRHEDIVQTPVASCDLDECGHEKFVGVGNLLGKELERRTGIETRVTVPGYVQRGGTPTAFDRVLGTRFGVAAVGQVLDGEPGSMVALQKNSIVTVPLAEVSAGKKPVDADFIRLMQEMLSRRSA